jgi:hypothetical protein
LDDSNDPKECKSPSRAEESGTRFIDSALGRSLNSPTLEYLISDDTVKRRRESDLPASPIPSAKRLHSGYHSPQQTSLQESPDRSNDNEFDTSLNKVRGLGNKINKRGSLSSLEILTPKHEAHTAKSRVHTINQLCEKDYTVGWICALKTELDAAHKMLDENHGEGLGHGSDDNYYILGKIGNHNVVLTCLPMGRYGNDNTAIVATRMINKFPNITIGLMVGIGGGLPNAKDDIRLGDVVVSKPDSLNGGILQYDKGKCTIDEFKCTGFLNAPPERLLSVLQRMPPRGSVLQTCSSLSYPGEELDHLFKPGYQRQGYSWSLIVQVDSTSIERKICKIQEVRMTSSPHKTTISIHVVKVHCFDECRSIRDIIYLHSKVSLFAYIRGESNKHVNLGGRKLFQSI